jgi:hypothetical protein
MLNQAPRHEDVTLCLIKHHVMKTYGLVELQHHVFLKLIKI